MLQSAFYAHSVEFAMRALSCLGCLLLLASANAVAGPVYKWKDAHGVTQYSETPPAGKKYETREQARTPQAAASTETPRAGSRAVQHGPGQPGPAGRRWPGDAGHRW